jgi:hypothetical protein
LQNPFHTIYKGMDPIKDLEVEVRAWMAKLAPLIDAAGMMSGRMVIESIERTGAQRHGGLRYCAYIELSTLRADVVVARDQVGNEPHEDVYVAVRNAFRLLRRLLTANQESRTLLDAAAGVTATDAVGPDAVRSPHDPILPVLG